MSIHTLRKRFIKDQGLPISVVQDPHFKYLIDLYDPIFGCKAAYKQCIKEARKAGGIKPFLAQYYAIRDAMIADLKENEAFIRFNQDPLAAYEVKNPFPKKDIFRPENDGKIFISFDLVKANFHSLLFYDASMYNGATSYEEWLSRYTSSEHMKSSKYLRQVVFGNLNPKKQVKLETYIISKYLEAIIKVVPSECIQNTSHDELVIVQTGDFELSMLEKEIQQVTETFGVPIRMDVFRLQKQGYSSALGFVKESLSGGKPIFKSVPSIFMPQAYKKYMQLAPHPSDFVFFHEGQLARFLQPI